ncbi:MAG TPA: GH1 family beta-glucosidase [Anaerolineaceae bacterium]|nr:GH1 family beta-glucosidase [Anaerolineaceae bacterium]HPN51375.1 GH1 family beta-glucosidase [Anaerolineaceae bacterium]
MTSLKTFPADFLWGAATSSYQIEGAWDADGKSESIWDRFSHTPGKVKNGDTGDVACDHYHRWPEDIALMRQMGLKAYRFSIAWPRILPAGRGKVNQAGLDFYSRLVDGLLEAGIDPMVTLFHWDLPQILEDEGGFASRTTAEAFVELTDVVSRKLGDRVKFWATHNEPAVHAYLGYAMGVHAPGLKDYPKAARCTHHLLLSHGWAVPVIRANSAGAKVGMVLNVGYSQPASHSPADMEAYRFGQGMWLRWFTDPLYGRGYPGDTVADFTALGALPNGLDFVQPGDMAAIATPTDYLGINYYARHLTRAEIPEEQNLPVEVVQSDEMTDIGWEVFPEGLSRVLTQLYLTYHMPALYVTENGASYATPPSADGAVHDERRTSYLQRHLAACQRAIEAGVPLKGYFCWSLFDNFEWAEGFDQRFGLIWVDFATQQRILKDSALWYSRTIALNGVLA